MKADQIEPFHEFFNKMNKDLAGWLQNERKLQDLLDD